MSESPPRMAANMHDATAESWIRAGFPRAVPAAVSLIPARGPAV